MHPFFIGRIDAVFERDVDGSLELYNVPVLGFIGGIGDPLVRHPRTSHVVSAPAIPGYIKILYSRTVPSVFHFCRTGVETEPEAWRIHYAIGDIEHGFMFTH